METIKNKFDEITINFEKISDLSPELMAAWDRFTSMTDVDGALNRKRKDLIAIALSVYAKCQWCIVYHVKKALDQGAQKQEIIEAAWLAVLLGGSPALMHAQLVLKALEEFQGAYDEDEFVPTKRVRKNKKHELLELRRELNDYVRTICDTSEIMCHGSTRRRLALNIARTDGSVLKRLATNECEERGWLRSQAEADITGDQRGMM